MSKSRKKIREIDFLLENKHYKRLHLLLYLISISIITIVYFITIIVFSQYFHFIITTIFSFMIGLYVVMNRSRLVRKISDIIEKKKRDDYKKKSKENLKTTIRKIVPRNRKLKLDIKGKVSLKEKFDKFKLKFTKNKKKERDYIEIK